MSASASFVKSLLAQCCLGGICEWVVCPGARNMALLQVLAAAEDLVKWTHFDERSAAFFALGRIQDMGLPVAVVTTSGTAAAELLPAVVEAYYQRRPLLLLTADRPADYRGSAAPQRIPRFPGGTGPSPALQIARRAGGHARRTGPHGAGPCPVARE